MGVNLREDWEETTGRCSERMCLCVCVCCWLVMMLSNMGREGIFWSCLYGHELAWSCGGFEFAKEKCLYPLLCFWSNDVEK